MSVAVPSVSVSFTNWIISMLGYDCRSIKELQHFIMMNLLFVFSFNNLDLKVTQVERIQS